MRNVFDQYSQPENRLTHALACSLDADRTLLRPFLTFLGVRPPDKRSTLHVVEQQVPGELESGDEDVRRGLPDACIFDDYGWSVLIESKAQAQIELGQLDRHVRTAARHGFPDAQLVVLSIDPRPRSLPERVLHREWREVYAWFRTKAAQSSWARAFTNYLEVFETRLPATGYSLRGTLTMFDGLRFDEDTPYTYREAKRLLKLLRGELIARKDLQRELGMDPEGKGRTAITGREVDYVWDFLPLRVARDAPFTHYPHLTITFFRANARAAVTVPNGVRGGFRARIKELGREGFLEFLSQVYQDLEPTLALSQGARAMLYATQRHYRTQRADPEVDARLDTDLRTAVRGARRGAKYQPEWIGAIYEVLVQKKSNIQLGLEVCFEYDCPRVSSREVIDLYASAWLGMRRWLAFVTTI